ncbi:MAG: amidohydrolase family protein [Acidimicrobiales bacterium]
MSSHDEDRRLPLPTQFVSNGEFVPLPQSARQRRVEAHLNAMADERVGRAGTSRRAFLRSQAGMAAAFAALNAVYGCADGDAATPPGTTRPPASTDAFPVTPESTVEESAACELFAGEYFILDSQTHHVDFEGPADPALLNSIYGRFTGCPPAALDPAGPCEPGSPAEKLSRANYLKEIFLDSETTVAMMSGIPAGSTATQTISNDGMAATCEMANELGSSQRCILQGMLTPNFPDTVQTGQLGTLVRDMEHLKEDLGIRALKCYTGAGGAGSAFPFPGWWLDDEAVAYPMYEEAERLGIGVVNVHKGFEQGVFDPEYCSPRDFPKAVADWPNLNFVCFHSAVDLPPYERYLDDLLRLRREEMGDATNVFTELGGAWATRVIQGGDAAAHFLGRLLLDFGEDQILWGTDAIWNGSPQWQINALKLFRMPERLMEEFGYPEVTPEIKAKIFGLNAAKLYGVDPDEARCVVPGDAIAEAKIVYDGEGLAQPSNRRYGPTTRREFFRRLRRDGFA